MSSARPARRAALLLLLGAAACGDDAPGGAGGGGAGDPGQTTVDSRGELALPQTLSVFGGTVGETDDQTFTWGPDTRSVAVYAEIDGTREGDFAFLSFLRGPDGADLFRAGDDLGAFVALGRPLRPGIFPSSASLLLPEADGIEPAPGTYTFRVGATLRTARLWVVMRTGAASAEGTLDVDLYFVPGCGLSRADVGGKLAPAIDEMFSIFRSAGISRGTVRGVDLEGPGAAALVAPRIELASTSALRSLVRLGTGGGPRSVALFFTRVLEGDDPTQLTLGISMGVPAALGVHGTIGSGVVLAVEAHKVGSAIDFRELGSTMAHETAHSMGLFHTTERDGRKHDLVSDTPECAPDNDRDGNGVSPDECAELGGRNFLFWTGTGNRDVSAGQREILLRSPVVRGR